MSPKEIITLLRDPKAWDHEAMKGPPFCAAWCWLEEVQNIAYELHEERLDLDTRSRELLNQLEVLLEKGTEERP